MQDSQPRSRSPRRAERRRRRREWLERDRASRAGRPPVMSLKERDRVEMAQARMQLALGTGDERKMR